MLPSSAFGQRILDIFQVRLPRQVLVARAAQEMTTAPPAATSSSLYVPSWITLNPDFGLLPPHCQSAILSIDDEWLVPPSDLLQHTLTDTTGISASDPCRYLTELPPKARSEWSSYIATERWWLSVHYSEISSAFVTICGGHNFTTQVCTKVPAASPTSGSSGSGSVGRATPGSRMKNASRPQETGIVGGAAAAVGAIAAAVLM